ncbi:MAG TPA: hypothetical protein VMM93_01335 [Vicinamibacterales bacterium]|nr:hypothetical protein [Vicinamibacterales bacterium]
MNAHEMARTLGSRGGRARARRLPAEERKRIASLGGRARRQSLEAARRIDSNFAYAAVVGELQGGRRPVTPIKHFKGPLPGIYATGASGA